MNLGIPNPNQTNQINNQNQSNQSINYNNNNNNNYPNPMQNQHHNIDTNQSYISHGSSAGNQSITTLPNLIGNIQQLHNDQNINQVDLQEHTQGNVNVNINNNNNSTGMGMSTGNNNNNVI